MFPGESAEYKNVLVQKMCGRVLTPDIHEAECPKSLISALCTVDGEDMLYFENVLIMALGMKENIDKQTDDDRKAPAKSDAAAGSESHPIPPPEVAPAVIAMEGSSSKWKGATPKEFVPLLPGQHSLPYVYLQVKPTLFIGIYQSGLEGPRLTRPPNVNLH